MGDLAIMMYIRRCISSAETCRRRDTSEGYRAPDGIKFPVFTIIRISEESLKYKNVPRAELLAHNAEKSGGWKPGVA